MNSRGRVLIALGAVLVTIFGELPASAHAVQGEWTSPAPNQPPVATQPVLAGSITHDDDLRPIRRVTFDVRPTTEQPEACGKPPTLPNRAGNDQRTVNWMFKPGPPPQEPEPGVGYYAAFACNGTYQLAATAELSSLPGHDPVAPVTATLAVAIPAPPPSAIEAVLDGADDERAITVTWPALDPAPADLVGYVVERRIGEGAWEQIGATGLDELQLVDSAPASTGGTFVYRVASIRLGASGAADDLVPSPPSGEAALVVSSPEAPAGGSDGSGDTEGGDKGSPIARAPHAVVSRGGGSGSVAGELQRQAQSIQSTGSSASSPPTTADTGYKPTLDYGGKRRRAAGGGGGGLLGGVLGETPEERKSMLVPLAGALVLLMWFVHVRHLLRRAAEPVALLEHGT